MTIAAVPKPLREPDQQVVAMLEELLAKAKAGDLVGLGLVAENVDGTMHVRRYGCKPGNAYKLVGAVEQLKHDMVRAWLSDPENR